MAFRVDVTLKAYRDLSGILRWLLAEHAGEQGLGWYDGLNKAIDTLSEAQAGARRLRRTQHHDSKSGICYMAINPIYTGCCSRSKVMW